MEDELLVLETHLRTKKVKNLIIGAIVVGLINFLFSALSTPIWSETKKEAVILIEVMNFYRFQNK